MAEFPALPLWTDAYLGDTTHLTTIEHGAYFLLIVTAWRTRDCVLPDDDRLLARFARCTGGQWKRLRPILEPFFHIENGQWKQGRLLDEREAVEQHRKLQSEKGKAGAAAKALKNKHRRSAGAKPGLSTGTTPASAQDKLPTPTPYSEDKSSGADAPAKSLIDLGVGILTGAGCSAKEARSLVGKWRKAKGDAEVRAAFDECLDDDISEPISWLTKRLTKSRYVSASGFEYRGDAESVMRQAEHRADWNTYWQAKGDLEGRGAKSASG